MTNDDDTTLWTYTVRCQECGVVLNTAEHVPTKDKGHVAMTAPLMAFCEVKSHNTYSDMNLHYNGEWIDETRGDA